MCFGPPSFTTMGCFGAWLTARKPPPGACLLLYMALAFTVIGLRGILWLCTSFGTRWLCARQQFLTIFSLSLPSWTEIRTLKTLIPSLPRPPTPFALKNFGFSCRLGVAFHPSRSAIILCTAVRVPCLVGPPSKLCLCLFANNKAIIGHPTAQRFMAAMMFTWLWRPEALRSGSFVPLVPQHRGGQVPLSEPSFVPRLRFDGVPRTAAVPVRFRPGTSALQELSDALQPLSPFAPVPGPGSVLPALEQHASATAPSLAADTGETLDSAPGPISASDSEEDSALLFMCSKRTAHRAKICAMSDSQVAFEGSSYRAACGAFLLTEWQVCTSRPQGCSLCRRPSCFGS